MPIDALPSISRSDTDFRTKVDDYFLTKLPTFSTQAEEARLQIVAAESKTTSAANAASTDANTATTAANTATSARDSAVAAKDAAETAAAQAVSGNVATPIHEAVSKTTPVDADELGLSDSAASWGLKKLTFENLKAWLTGLFVSRVSDSSIVTPSGQATFTVKGGTDRGNVVLSAGAADGAGSAAGAVGFVHDAATASSGEKRIALISAVADGATAEHRGGKLSFSTKVNGSTSLVERLAIDSSGNLLVTGGGALGHGVGSGGTASQPGQNGSNQAKNLGVTLQKPSGVITMGNASLAAGASVPFLLSCSYASATSGATTTVVVLNASVGSGLNYRAEAVSTTSGGVYIRLTNVSAGALAEAVQIQFNTHAGAST